MGRVLLVRHGQASFGADDYDVLSETGWAQGRLLGGWLAAHGVTPTALVRGDMRRHRETLEAMQEGAAAAGGGDGAGWSAATTVDADWDEFDHLGIVAGHPDLPADGPPMGGDRRAFQRIFEESTARWTAGEAGEAAETYVQFVARVRAGLERAGAAAGAGETVVVVTSGGTIGVACALLSDPENDDPVGFARQWSRFNSVVVNSSVTRVVVGSTGARLLTFNEHTHLDAEHLTYR